MKRVALLMLAASMPAQLFAQDVPQPKYPPGFGCDTLPPGDERAACRQSDLNPKTDSNEDGGRSVTGSGAESPGSMSPPTFPDEPGSENRDSGPGGEGGAGGVGN